MVCLRCMSVYRDFMVVQPTMAIYRDLIMLRLCQVTEFLCCTDYVNFTEILWCLDSVKLHIFFLAEVYGVPTMPIYRYFMVSRLCQFTEISWCLDYASLQLQDFAEISWCPDHVNLHRLCGVPTMSIYRDFT